MRRREIQQWYMYRERGRCPDVPCYTASLHATCATCSLYCFALSTKRPDLELQLEQRDAGALEVGEEGIGKGAIWKVLDHSLRHEHVGTKHSKFLWCEQQRVLCRISTPPAQEPLGCVERPRGDIDAHLKREPRRVTMSV